ncbi:ABC-2 family transporter protein [Carnobacterium divergens]|uniref:ABC transporter permease n=1 Tax=Carnobacterium divergens TaxID=2748 RepID=UPI0013A5680E
MRRLLNMEKIFIAQDLKRIMEYKNDFLIGIVSVIIVQATNLMFLNIIFSNIPTLGGWSFQQILFIYGFSLIPKGIDHLFFDNLWALGYFIIRKGEFDKYLTRPLSPLFQILVEKFQLDALGELFIGLVFIVASKNFVKVEWNFFNLCIIVLSVIFSTLIYTSIKIATSALAFWIKRSGNITFMFYMLNDFAKYPTTIYNGVIRAVITYIVPFAFTAYYPASYFLTGENIIFNIGGLFLISSIFLASSIFIWQKGLIVYESAGS